ncbi:uncharacterized protein LOC125444130 [Sphaerodactylus townsendi]|uniref:uncharacterized protein LOC125444130 n=1 Tax=Sphaerodactylus townsendi TaxID=933632 RepID=UPI0020268A3E|nr:uncharacterized protein LOC125444130 [Sphaerodactylus townsendi]
MRGIPPRPVCRPRGTAKGILPPTEDFSSEDSFKSLHSYDTSHQALGLACEGIARGDPIRQKGGSGVTVYPRSDQRSAPRRQDSAGHKAQDMDSRFRWLWSSRDAGSSLSASRLSRECPGSSPPKHLEQGKVEARTSLSLATDKTLAKTNPLEAELKVLRSSSHPQSSQFLQALERPVQIMNELLAENQRLQKELNNSQGLQVRSLQAEVKRLQQELLKQQDSKKVSENRLVAENQRLQQELNELEEVKNVQEVVIANLQVENQDLREELEEFQRQLVPKSKTEADEPPVPQMTGTRKALLVVLHYKQKNNTKLFVDIKPKVPHPALVGTVHACFSMQDGFYHCQINQDAVESVAATIMQFTQDS